MSSEEWRPIAGHPLLEASSLGRIRSLPYVQMMPRGGERTRQMNPTYGVIKRGSGGPRKQVTFQRHTLNVGRLVCLAFHGPPPPDKPNALHRDENACNNVPGNLEWGSQKENLNAPGFLAYCASRTGENSPVRKGRQKQIL